MARNRKHIGPRSLESKVKIGRIAFRIIDEKWNVYYALPDTMDKAIYLGCITVDLARNEIIKEKFMQFMQMTVGMYLEDIVKEKPEWQRETPPGKDRFQ